MSEYPELISRSVERFPNAVAVRCSDGDMSYPALETRVSQCANSLRAIADTGRIAIRLEPGPESIAVWWGALRAGWCVCPISDRLPDKSVAAAAKILQPTIQLGNLPQLGDAKTISLQELFQGEPSDYAALRVGSTQEAVIIPTSGSTGSPKLSVLSYGNLFCNAVNANHNIDVGPNNVWLLSLPTYHVGGIGIVVRCALDGGTVAVPDPGEALHEAIARYGVTHISVVATQLRRLLKSGADISGLRCVLLGGGPVARDLVEECKSRGIPIYTTYGLTEMASQVTTTASGDDAERLATSGKPLDTTAIRISDSREIEVSGDCLFQGYLSESGIDRPLNDAGWYRTGDLGDFDILGYLHVSGRRDNMFISGGENIQPEEIEAALHGCEGVERAVVVPIPDDEWGQRPVAFIATENGTIDKDALNATLLARLPKYKVPDAMYPWPDDVDLGLKISRSALRAKAMGPADQTSESTS